MIKHPGAWKGVTAELRGDLMSRPRGDHPAVETYCQIILIVLVKAGLSGQQSPHSYVDLSSAP